jgi:5-methyltetrahydropteroyltriglutamate--homocysteine methyltransferase
VSAETPHTETVGSLLPPDFLSAAIEPTAALQDRAVLEAIELQEACGLDVVTDGELRRQYWHDPATKGFSGYEHMLIDLPVHSEDGASTVPYDLPVVSERLSLADNLPLGEFEFLRRHTACRVKVTLPGVSFLSVLWAPERSEGYADRDEYQQHAAALLKEVVAGLVAAGATYIQLDSPRYTQLISESGRENLRRVLHVDVDPSVWLEQMIGLDNEVMDAFPEVTFGLHLCRGNFRGMWSAEGGFDPIAEQLFGSTSADRLLLEYDSPRCGTFEPLRFVPSDKIVVLGLVSTRVAEVETSEMLRRRVEEAARYFPADRLAISPQCGFAAVPPGNPISRDAQRAKLAVLSETARDLWDD